MQTLENSGELRRDDNRPKNRPNTIPTAPKTAPANTHRFTYRGRLLTIYRRGPAWYFRIQRDGQTRKFSLGNVTTQVAIVAAKKIASAADQRKWDTLAAALSRGTPRRAPANAPTLGEFLDTWRKLDHVSRDTADAYLNCLGILLRTTHPDANHRRLTVLEVFSRATAARWFAAASTRAAAVDQQDGNRIKRTANSVYGQAKSLISQAAIDRLELAGLKLPPLDFKYSKFGKIRSDYNPPSPDLIRRTLHDWLTLPRNEFLAVGLELSAGLRIGEISQSRWSWLQPARVNGRAQVKGGTGEVDVHPLDPFWTVMNRRIRREHWRTAPDDYVLVGTPTERREDTFKRVGEWMRALGWQTQKTNHAFRAYVGSLVALRWDIYRAKLFLRHAQIAVTETNYSHFVAKQKTDAFRPGSIRIRLAR